MPVCRSKRTLKGRAGGLAYIYACTQLYLEQAKAKDKEKG